MKRLKRTLFLFLVISLTVGTFCSVGWAQEDVTKDEWNIMDLFIARPLGFAAGIVGTGLFVVSLPFTVPTGGVNDAAETFITKPFKFSFKREFPDRDMLLERY
jgi:hypothetical protein